MSDRPIKPVRAWLVKDKGKPFDPRDNAWGDTMPIYFLRKEAMPMDKEYELVRVEIREVRK